MESVVGSSWAASRGMARDIRGHRKRGGTLYSTSWAHTSPCQMPAMHGAAVMQQHLSKKSSASGPTASFSYLRLKVLAATGASRSGGRLAQSFCYRKCGSPTASVPDRRAKNSHQRPRSACAPLAWRLLRFKPSHWCFTTTALLFLDLVASVKTSHTTRTASLTIANSPDRFDTGACSRSTPLQGIPSLQPPSAWPPSWLAAVMPVSSFS